MTTKEKRAIAKKIADIEMKLIGASEIETTKLMVDMAALALKVGSLDDMEEIDEMVQDILAES